MEECILITTIDGNTHRFDKKHVKNYQTFKNIKNLEELLKNTLLVVETNSRNVYFIVSNITKLEII